MEDEDDEDSDRTPKTEEGSSELSAEPMDISPNEEQEQEQEQEEEAEERVQEREQKGGE